MPRAAFAEQLVGRFTLQSWTAGRADGAVTHPFGKVQGTLIYTPGGWITVQLAGQGSGLSSDEVWTNFDVHADTAAQRLAYCGRNRTDGDVVILDVTMSTSGQWVGTNQIRRCQLRDDNGDNGEFTLAARASSDAVRGVNGVGELRSNVVGNAVADIELNWT